MDAIRKRVLALKTFTDQTFRLLDEKCDAQVAVQNFGIQVWIPNRSSTERLGSLGKKSESVF